jgi:hypothetical protein
MSTMARNRATDVVGYVDICKLLSVVSADMPQR